MYIVIALTSRSLIGVCHARQSRTVGIAQLLGPVGQTLADEIVAALPVTHALERKLDAVIVVPQPAGIVLDLLGYAELAELHVVTRPLELIATKVLGQIATCRRLCKLLAPLLSCARHSLGKEFDVFILQGCTSHPGYFTCIIFIGLAVNILSTVQISIERCARRRRETAVVLDLLAEALAVAGLVVAGDGSHLLRRKLAHAVLEILLECRLAAAKDELLALFKGDLHTMRSTGDRIVVLAIHGRVKAGASGAGHKAMHLVFETYVVILAVDLVDGLAFSGRAVLEQIDDLV